MTKILDKVPRPLLDDIVAGRCIPIIGAGFSLNAKTKLDKKMPLWEELGKEIANLLPDYQYSTPLDSLSAYSHEYSRVNLIERIVELLQVDSAQPGKVHNAFCELPFDIVCTTNFDFLLEKAYNIKSPFTYCRPIINQEQLTLSSSKAWISLIKLHGDLDHPERLIVTEDDYDTFIDKYPILATYLANLLITRTPLFIGYSLEDPDFRQIWQVIGNRLGKMRRTAYVLTAGKNPSKEARYERRGVKAVNLTEDHEKYEAVLIRFFEELKEYWLPKTIENINFTDEEILSELSMPKENANRLCFFAISNELSPFYKSVVFPIVENFGLVPMTVDSMISSSDSLYAGMKALLDRATIIVADETTNWVLSEVSTLLLKKKNPPNVLIIKREGEEIQKGLDNVELITRPKDLTDIPDEFLKKIENFFEKKTDKLFNNYSNESIRLLEKKEYKAAIISSIILLETTLRESLEKNCNFKSRHLNTLSSMNFALDIELIDKTDYDLLRKVLQVRNYLVHSNGSVNSKEASNMVNGVLKVIDKIKASQS